MNEAESTSSDESSSSLSSFCDESSFNDDPSFSDELTPYDEFSSNDESTNDMPSATRELSSFLGFNDDTFSMKKMSRACLCSCACWSLYNCKCHSCIFLCISSAIISCYSVLGILRGYSIRIHNLFQPFIVLVTTLPIVCINAHVFTCDCLCSTFQVLAALLTVPLLLKVIYPNRKRYIVDVIVWSNVHSLGLQAVENSSLLGLVISVWQAFYYMAAWNSYEWLQTTSEIPFNLGLSGMCWCLIITNFMHNET